jgi:hypothetical protein
MLSSLLRSAINKASSNSWLTAAGRWATASDRYSQNCLQTLFFSSHFSFSLPLMRQLNYTCMLNDLLKLYCIWTCDTLSLPNACLAYCSLVHYLSLFISLTLLFWLLFFVCFFVFPFFFVFFAFPLRSPFHSKYHHCYYYKLENT